MKKLDSYLIREMIVPFLIGTVAVVLMFQVNAYMYMAKTYNLERIPITAILQYIMFKTPEYMKMTLPVGTSLAAALTITRLARDSELTAMRAAGARILRVVAPVAAFGLVVAIGNFLLVERVIPESTRRANVILMEAGVMALDRSTVESNALIKLGQYTASLGSVRREGQYKLVIDDVTLFEHPEAGVSIVITARTATYDRGIWTFMDGYYWQLRKGELYLAEPRGSFTVNQKIVVDSLFGSGEREERSIKELQDKIASSKKIGINAKEDEIELQTRYSVPIACLVFSIVSPIFGVIFSRSGGFTGVLVSFVVVLLYFNAFVVSTEILGKFSWCPVWFAAWSPNIIFTTLGLIGLRRFGMKLVVAALALGISSVGSAQLLPFANSVGAFLKQRPENPLDIPQGTQGVRTGDLPPPVGASQDLEVIRCNAYRREDNLVFLDGGVEFIYKGYRTFADRAEGDLNTSIFTLIGNVRVIGSDATTVDGEQIEINYDTRTFRATDSRAILPPASSRVAPRPPFTPRGGPRSGQRSASKANSPSSRPVNMKTRTLALSQGPPIFGPASESSFVTSRFGSLARLSSVFPTSVFLWTRESQSTSPSLDRVATKGISSRIGTACHLGTDQCWTRGLTT